MARIEEIPCRDWAEFKSTILKELFDDSFFKRDVFLFRGQGSAEWRLEPSFDRVFSNLDRNLKSGTMKELLRVFRAECGHFDVPDEFWNDDYVALALGQHYGLPTRLLDWSDSPYVAAFFAFHNALVNTNRVAYVAIWALDRRASSVWSEDSGVRVFSISSVGNLRLRNQYGKFTLLNSPFDCLEDYVLHCPEPAVVLHKFIIPCSSSREAIADLDAMGINHSRMYPEIVGAALSARLRVILNQS